MCREAVRGEDLLLLTHSCTSEGNRAEGSGAGLQVAALLAIVDKVESEKELDGSRKLVAYVTVCLTGNIQCHSCMTINVQCHCLLCLVPKPGSSGL